MMPAWRRILHFVKVLLWFLFLQRYWPLLPLKLSITLLVYTMETAAPVRPGPAGLAASTAAGNGSLPSSTTESAQKHVAAETATLLRSLLAAQCFDPTQIIAQMQALAAQSQRQAACQQGEQIAGSTAPAPSTDTPLTPKAPNTTLASSVACNTVGAAVTASTVRANSPAASAAAAEAVTAAVDVSAAAAVDVSAAAAVAAAKQQPSFHKQPDTDCASIADAADTSQSSVRVGGEFAELRWDEKEPAPDASAVGSDSSSCAGCDAAIAHNPPTTHVAPAATLLAAALEVDAIEAPATAPVSAVAVAAAMRATAKLAASPAPPRRCSKRQAAAKAAATKVAELNDASAALDPEEARQAAMQQQAQILAEQAAAAQVQANGMALRAKLAQSAGTECCTCCCMLITTC